MMNNYYIVQARDSNNSNSPKNLLIIGNGFDLYCKLNSSFTSFLLNEIKDQQQKSTNFKDLIRIANKSTSYKHYSMSHIKFDNKNQKTYIQIIISLYDKYFHSFCSKNSSDISKSKLEARFDNGFVSLLKKMLNHSSTKPINNNLYDMMIDLYGKCNGNKNNFWLMYFELLFSMENFIKNGYSMWNWSNIEYNIMIFMTKYSKDLIIYIQELCEYKKNNDVYLNLRNYLFKHIFSKRYFSWIFRSKTDDKRLFYGIKGQSRYFLMNMSFILLILCGFFDNIGNTNLQNKSYLEDYFERDFYKFLYNQLEKFEQIFSTYMSKELKRHYNKIHFLNNVSRLIDKLLPNKNNKFNLLSFNYIIPNKKDINKKSNNNNKLITSKNVHSVLGSQPIMGINANDCINKNTKQLEPYIIFSKSFRIMRLSNKLVSNHILPDKVNKIIFFGHSLDDADYPYFQSIFDKYNIYDSSVVLIFCYSVHSNGHNIKDNKKYLCCNKGSKQKYLKVHKYYMNIKDKCATSLYHSVSNLINKYESTLDEKSHSKDLWSKLLIEDRLVLHCIDDNYLDKHK